MNSLNTLLYNEAPIPYTGSELAPLWIYRRFNVLGNALVSFVGEATVSIDHMVDLEDVKSNAPIYSPQMVHFIGEFFIDSLAEGVLLQHLLACIVYEHLLEKGVTPLRRRGNDIYFEDRKVSVSIATKTVSSVLIHMGVNVETQGTPVPTAGLQEWNLDPQAFAAEILTSFQRDWDCHQRARCKVLTR